MWLNGMQTRHLTYSVGVVQLACIGLILLGGLFVLSMPQSVGDDKPLAQRPLLEYLWTFRPTDGLGPPDKSTVFCVLIDPEDVGGDRKLIVGRDALASIDGLRLAVSGAIDDRTGIVLHRGPAPPREIAFQRFDLDHDGVDEVLLTGAGGAGRTSFLTAFRVRENKIDVLFQDSSRFGFHVYDRQGNGQFEIANAGFDSVAHLDGVLKEHHFTLFELKSSQYVRQRVVDPKEMKEILSQLKERVGTPVTDSRANGVLRIYEKPK